MRFILHHIPKSGGSSIVGAAGKVMRCHRAAFQNQVSDPYRYASGEGLYSSHYLFRDYQPRDGEVYFTWIRDPVAMFYSAFYYYRPRTIPRGYDPVETRDFIDSVLCQSCDVREYVDTVLESQHAHAFPRGMFDLDWSRFHFIGVAERMRESVSRFNELYGLNLTVEHANRTEGDRDYRRDEVRALLAHEVEVYESLL